MDVVFSSGTCLSPLFPSSRSYLQRRPQPFFRLLPKTTSPSTPWTAQYYKRRALGIFNTEEVKNSDDDGGGHGTLLQHTFRGHGNHADEEEEEGDEDDIYDDERREEVSVGIFDVAGNVNNRGLNVRKDSVKSSVNQRGQEGEDAEGRTEEKSVGSFAKAGNVINGKLISRNIPSKSSVDQKDEKSDGSFHKAGNSENGKLKARKIPWKSLVDQNEEEEEEEGRRRRRNEMSIESFHKAGNTDNGDDWKTRKFLPKNLVEQKESDEVKKPLPLSWGSNKHLFETRPVDRHGDESDGVLFEEEEEGGDQLTKIPVPRQKYIPTSKSALVSALTQSFSNDEDASDFSLICSCLEAILHAEHKKVLEELRIDYRLSRTNIEKTKQNEHAIKEESKERNKRDSKPGKLNFMLALMKKKYDDSSFGRKRKRKGYQSSPEDNKSTRDRSQLHVNGAVQNRQALENHERENIECNHFSNESGVSTHNHIEQPPALSNSSSEVSENVSDVATKRFQQNFMWLLKNARFEGLSARDLQITYALNNDYLLTLPVDVDWKHASSSYAIIFRRGYAAERQEGLLLGEKFDYLQALLLRKIFNGLSGPLFLAGTWINQKWKALAENEDSKTWTEFINKWLKEPLRPDIEDDLPDPFGAQSDENDLPIWMAAQQAVPRYDAFLSSAGSRGRLLRKILVWMRLLPSQEPDIPAFTNDTSSSEPHLRQNELRRISMRDIWLPASKKVCGNNIWLRLQKALGILFFSSTLQEPAFKELVLLYNAPYSNGKFKKEVTPKLQLKIYKRIPIPDLKVVFPNKKLSFRILDTVRLDLAAIIGLLAFLINYRFDDILSSPSAFILDLVASSALVVYITRVALGYKQTWDRYQLLVNKTLYEKTLASGFGAVHFLVDASEQQKFKEVIIAYALLMQAKEQKVESRRKLADLCERFLYNYFKEQIEMPIDEAVEALLRLGLVKEECSTTTQEGNGGGSLMIRACSFHVSTEKLKERWNSLLYDESVWNTK